MTTDNRTNELGKIRQNDAKHFAWSDEQVEAAAKAMWDLRKLSGEPEWDVLEYGVKNEYRKDARAALVAAQGAAPQASHNALIAKTFSEIHGDLRSFSHAEVKQIVYPLIDALRAPVQTSSTVDVDALAEVIGEHRHAYSYSTGRGSRYVGCACGERPVKLGSPDDTWLVRHQARAVVEAIGGERR